MIAIFVIVTNKKKNSSSNIDNKELGILAEKIDNSNVTANKISVVSRNSNSDSLNMKNNATTKDKTGVAISTLVKNEQIDTESLVSNGSVLTLNGEDKTANITSQNLNIASNSVTMKLTDAKEEKKPETQPGGTPGTTPGTTGTTTGTTTNNTNDVQNQQTTGTTTNNTNNQQTTEQPDPETRTVNGAEGENLDNLVDGVQKQMANSTSGETSQDNNGKNVSKNIKNNDSKKLLYICIYKKDTFEKGLSLRKSKVNSYLLFLN